MTSEGKAGPARQDDDAVVAIADTASAAYDGANAWLAQASRLRDRALRLAQVDFAINFAAAGTHPEPIPPSCAALRAEYTAGLMADYLVESEKMADLMRLLARKGLLARPQD